MANQLDGLAEFCSVVENGGFTKAATALGVSASFVSRRIKALESRLGVRLLHRTTRRVNLTDLGAQYHARAMAVLTELEAVETDLRDQQKLVKGHIRITAGGLFGETWVAGQIAGFANAHPNVDVHLELTDRRIDLIREGYDLGVRFGAQTDPDLVQRKLASRRIMTCASPAYLRRAGMPREPEDLLRHDCLVAPGQNWSFRRGREAVEVRVRSRWTCNSAVGLIAAALADLGIVRIAEAYLAPQLATGALVPVLATFEPPAQDISIVMPSRERVPHRVRMLIEWMAAAARREGLMIEAGAAQGAE